MKKIQFFTFAVLAAMSATLMSCESTKSDKEEDIPGGKIVGITFSSTHNCSLRGSSDGEIQPISNAFRFTEENSEFEVKSSGDYIHVTAQGVKSDDSGTVGSVAAEIEFDIDSSSKKVKNLTFISYTQSEREMGFMGTTAYMQFETTYGAAYEDIPFTVYQSDYKEAEIKGSEGLELKEFVCKTVSNATYSDPSIEPVSITQYFEPVDSNDDQLMMFISYEE